MLRRLACKLGNGVTTDYQLAACMSHTPGFVGVYDRHEFIRRVYPRMLPGSSAIVNLDAKWSQGGTHWVAVVIARDGRHVLYKDSFGVPPPEDFYKIRDKIVLYGTKTEQKLSEENCGQRAVAFIKTVTSARDDLDKFYAIA